MRTLFAASNPHSRNPASTPISASVRQTSAPPGEEPIAVGRMAPDRRIVEYAAVFAQQQGVENATGCKPRKVACLHPLEAGTRLRPGDLAHFNERKIEQSGSAACCKMLCPR